MRRIRQGVATEAYWESTVRKRNEAGADAAALECHRIYELKYLAALIAGLLLMAGCGPKAITVVSRPFPAENPVFSDASGKAIETLPTDGGAIRLVFLDFPWCPACADVWSGADGRGAVSSRHRPNLSDPVRPRNVRLPPDSGRSPRCTPPLSPKATSRAIPGFWRSSPSPRFPASSARSSA